MSIGWTVDELILVCEALAQNGWEPIPLADERVAELSALLRRSPEHASAERDDRFRSRSSIHLKLENLRTCHPSYRGAPTNASRLDGEVVRKFIENSEDMTARARRIRSAIAEGTVTPDEISALRTYDPEMTAHEGSIIAVLQQRRERDPHIRNRKIQQAREQRGTSPARCAASISRSSTGTSAAATSRFIIDVLFTSPARPRHACLTSPWSARTAIG